MLVRIVRALGRPLASETKSFSRLRGQPTRVSPTSLRPNAKKYKSSARKQIVKTWLWKWLVSIDWKSVGGTSLFLLVALQLYSLHRNKYFPGEAAFEGRDPETQADRRELVALYSKATSLRFVDHYLKKNWKGLKRNIPLVVGYETSMILETSPPFQWFELDEPQYEYGLPSYVLRAWPTASSTPVSESPPLSAENLELEPTDFGPFIRTILGAPTKGFIIVDGMKGCGKSTSMMLLCSHQIQNGKAAFFLKLSTQCDRPADCPEETFFKDPGRFRTLSLNLPDLTIVLDDFHQYLRDPGTKENAIKMAYTLWDCATLYGARVILTTSDYGLHESLTKLSKLHSAQIIEYRLPPPPTDQLKKMITEGLKKRQLDKLEGNSEADIDLYCHVIGTYRTILDTYLVSEERKVNSVGELTRTLFLDALLRMKTGIFSAVPKKYYFGKAKRTLWINECKNNKAPNNKCAELHAAMIDSNDYTGYVQTVLSTIAKEGVFDNVTPDWRKDICDRLQHANVIRHCSGVADAVEFHSYLEEVAVRALLDLPATKGSNGRGTQADIDSLVPDKKLKTTRADVQARLSPFT